MKIPEHMEIDSLEAFDALVAPRRLQLVEFFAEAGTAREAAERFDVPVTRLYYHINSLLDHGLLKVVAHKKRGGMVERHFQVAARSFRPSRRFMAQYGSAGLVEVIKLTFASAELALHQSVEAGLVSMERRDEERVALGYSSLRLTEANLRKLVRQINELINDTPDDPDGIRVGGLVAVFPKVGD